MISHRGLLGVALLKIGRTFGGSRISEELSLKGLLPGSPPPGVAFLVSLSPRLGES